MTYIENLILPDFWQLINPWSQKLITKSAQLLING